MRIVVTLLLLMALPSFAAHASCVEDPGVRDTVRIGSAIIPVVTPGQLISIPVYVYSDEDLAAFALGFQWSSPNIRYASVLVSQELSDLGFTMFFHRSDTVQNIIGVAAVHFESGVIPASNEARLMFTIRFMTKTGAVPSAITIDSSFFGIAAPFTLTPAPGGTGDDICPEYVHSPVDIHLGVIPGDADGSGIVSLADLVFVVNYIFSGGPSPTPLLSGDADCSGAINISDAVHLISYIFAGGPPPCEW